MFKMTLRAFVLSAAVFCAACDGLPPGSASRPVAAAQRSAAQILADARRHYESKEYDLAIADYSEYIKLIPNDPFGYLKRGVVYHAAGKHREAVADYTRSLEWDRDGSYRAGLYYNRGNARRDMGEYDQAIADYDEAIRSDPKYEHAIVSRGSVHSTRQEYDRAIADFDLALKIDPRDVVAYQHRAYARTRKGQFAEAVKDYGEAIKLRKDSPYALNARAWLLATCRDEGVRDGKQAVQDALRACELSEWKLAGNLDTLAAAYAETGDFAKAVEWQKKAIDLSSRDQKAELESRLELYKAEKPFRAPGN